MKSPLDRGRSCHCESLVHTCELILDFALWKGESVECALVLDASQHLDVCNFSDLEVLQQIL